MDDPQSYAAAVCAIAETSTFPVFAMLPITAFMLKTAVSENLSAFEWVQSRFAQ